MSEQKFSEIPVNTDAKCPVGTLYFLPQGSKTRDLATGKVLELSPGYWVNPKSIGMITDVK